MGGSGAGLFSFGICVLDLFVGGWQASDVESDSGLDRDRVRFWVSILVCQGSRYRKVSDNESI
jgi:hypothetical protein